MKFIPSKALSDPVIVADLIYRPLPPMPPAPVPPERPAYNDEQERPIPRTVGAMSHSEERFIFLQLNHAKKLLSESSAPPDYLIPRIQYITDYLIRINWGLISRIIINVGKQYKKMDWDDAVSDAGVGAIRAIETFDVDRECKFSTHLNTCVFRSVERNCKRKIEAEAKIDITCVDPNTMPHRGYEKAKSSEENKELELLNKVMEKNSADLSPEETRAIRGYIWEGKTFGEIGVELKLSKEKTRGIYLGALVKMRKVMGAAQE